MNKFLIEVYTGDAWYPFKLRDSSVGFRNTLKELGIYCYRNNLNMDVYRIRHLTNSSDIIDAGQFIDSQDTPHGK